MTERKPATSTAKPLVILVEPNDVFFGSLIEFTAFRIHSANGINAVNTAPYAAVAVYSQRFAPEYCNCKED